MAAVGWTVRRGMDVAVGPQGRQVGSLGCCCFVLLGFVGFCWVLLGFFGLFSLFFSFLFASFIFFVTLLGLMPGAHRAPTGAVPAQEANVLARFHFNSTLKRMSAIVHVSSGTGGTGVLAVCKGAPEVGSGGVRALKAVFTSDVVAAWVAVG